MTPDAPRLDLAGALRTTGAVRDFTDEPVRRDEIYDILDAARHAPSGGNRQGWRVIVVERADLRERLRDAYLDAWHDYVSHLLAGLIPFSPLATDAERRAAAAQRDAAIAASRPDGFAENLHAVPAMLVIGADLAALAATDRDLERYSIVGGASVYPFVWSILLAAREHGLGGVMTSVATRNEDAVRDILSIPPTWAVAAIVALGHPRHQPTKLTRRPVEDVARLDTFDGPPLERGEATPR
ncbi:MAG TPA: nitroreductase family protein [Acidimicrobiales bacterium]|nr:nitroreductase family protein [Acidimicrobiales bacterium]